MAVNGFRIRLVALIGWLSRKRIRLLLPVVYQLLRNQGRGITLGELSTVRHREEAFMNTIRISLVILLAMVALSLQADEYLGQLSSNRYDPDSVSNPYGRYGSEYSSDSINNPYGAGNRFRSDSPTNPYGEGLSIYSEEGD